MKAVLFRTSSVPVHSPAASGSPRVSISRQDSITGVFSGERHAVCSPRISLNLDSNRRKSIGIRRTLSESEIYGAELDIFSGFSKLTRDESRSFSGGIPEEEHDVDLDNCGSFFSTKGEIDSLEKIGIWPSNSIPVELDGGGNDGGNRHSKIGEYYRELLKSNPTDPLLLRNYGKYLHEVEKDTEKAEEYYGRAILASPEEGELLSLYADLIWNSNRDEERAKSYFDQAVYASPNDCMVLGSYAHFLWETEDEEEDEETEVKNKAENLSPAMVSAF